jgi:endonuclease/exonuclease/phosphatase family metal-dependent hydrolase
MKKQVFLVIMLLLFLSHDVWTQGVPKVRELKLLTYNVLADPVYQKERIPKLLQLLARSDADIIALQEVDSWFADILFTQEWVRNYHVPRKRNKIVIAHEFLILSKYPIHSYIHKDLPGPQRRTLFIVTIKINERIVSIGTCHLESLLDDGPIRARQLDRFFKYLKKTPDSFFLGDFNFGDGEQPETDHLHPDFQDVWLALYPDNPGYTWNREISAMALHGSFPGEPSRRIDRILVKSDVWKPKDIVIIGNEPVSAQDPYIFPSDHFGLLATLVFQEEEKNIVLKPL